MSISVTPTKLKEVLLVEPKRFKDERGFFQEIFHEGRYRDAIGLEFRQDNISYSKKGVIRGLHYQLKNPQAKLVSVLKGRVIDVAVDIRVGSPDFGQVVAVELSEENGRQLFIPAGFAHGFSVLSSDAIFLYKCSELYTPGDEFGIRYDDPELAIDWQVKKAVVSEKDKDCLNLKDTPEDCLPVYGNNGKSVVNL